MNALSALVITGTFLVLWVTLAARAQGIETSVAVARGAALFGLTSGMSLLWAPVMGFIMDRVDRVTALVIGAGIATAGFIAVGLIGDPLDRSMLPLFMLLGIGQASCLYASQTLIGQEAPIEGRGAVIGVFSTCGAAGVLAASVIGGRLFDAVGPGAPFLLVGGATAVVLVWAIAVRMTQPAPDSAIEPT